jgi:hypothetical protein
MSRMISNPALQDTCRRNSQDRGYFDLATLPQSTIEGENHFDVHVFRNQKVLKCTKPHCQSYSLEYFLGSNGNSSKTLSADTERGILEESSRFITGQITKSDLKSNLPDHSMLAHTMNAPYLSQVRRGLGLYPIVTIHLKSK